jgi:hypothetical protein
MSKSTSKSWWGAAWCGEDGASGGVLAVRGGGQIRGNGNKVQRIRLEGRTIIARCRMVTNASRRTPCGSPSMLSRGSSGTSCSPTFGTGVRWPRRSPPATFRWRFRRRFRKPSCASCRSAMRTCIWNAPAPTGSSPASHLVAAWLKFARDFERDPFAAVPASGDGARGTARLLCVAAPHPVPENRSPKQKMHRRGRDSGKAGAPAGRSRNLLGGARVSSSWPRIGRAAPAGR